MRSHVAFRRSRLPKKKKVERRRVRAEEYIAGVPATGVRNPHHVVDGMDGCPSSRSVVLEVGFYVQTDPRFIVNSRWAEAQSSDTVCSVHPLGSLPRAFGMDHFQSGRPYHFVIQVKMSEGETDQRAGASSGRVTAISPTGAYPSFHSMLSSFLRIPVEMLAQPGPISTPRCNHTPHPHQETSVIVSLRCAIPPKINTRPPRYRYGRSEASRQLRHLSQRPWRPGAANAMCVSVISLTEAARGSHSTDGVYPSCRLGAGVVQAGPRQSKSLSCQCPHWMDICTCASPTSPQHRVFRQMLHAILAGIREANIPTTRSHMHSQSPFGTLTAIYSSPCEGQAMLWLVGNGP